MKDIGVKEAFRGICLGVPGQKDWGVFKRLIAQVLPKYGCNTLVLRVSYQYQFSSHPQVADAGAISPEQAAEIATLCRENGIRIIPKMNLLGHQSGKNAGTELGLLRAYPTFDETPDMPTVRYCRSLCPRHPQVKDIVFDLIDELVDAFQADAIHVGLDEVFEIGHCPRCQGTPNAELFADWVNALHGHIVGKRKIEMLMWGDRLLDAEATGYGEWEASANHTWEMIERIPRDIVICDWHYEERDDGYPSIPFFTGHGFRVVVCPWRNLRAAELLLASARADRAAPVWGVLATSWRDSGEVARYLCDNDDSVSETAKQVGEVFKAIWGTGHRGASVLYSY